jgi:hypothetical protein
MKLNTLKFYVHLILHVIVMFFVIVTYLLENINFVAHKILLTILKNFK